MRTRKAVSQILGTLLMLAIVAAAGAVILLQGMNVINDFNFAVTTEDSNKEIPQEDLVIEHVRFDPDDEDITLYIRNTGTIEVTVGAIKILKIDTQEIVLSNDAVAEDIPIKEIRQIDLTASLQGANQKWNSTTYADSTYRIVLETNRGNLFETVAKPFNT